jgi:hypothetical protein
VSTKPRGFVIVDKLTNAIDWDAELHSSREEAIESMCNPRQMYVRTAEEVIDGEKYHWSEHYDICEVRNTPITTKEK